MSDRTNETKGSAPLIDLVLPGFDAYANALLWGVRDYADYNTDWRIVIHHHMSNQLERDLLASESAGILFTPSLFYQYFSLVLPDKPSVCIDEYDPFPGRATWPHYTVPDNFQIGKLGAQHLLERQFPHFAFYGRSGLWSRTRQRGFMALLADAGHACQTNGDPDNQESFDQWPKLTSRLRIREWLIGLERPVAIMASEDETAALIVEMAEELGWIVGKDFIILGVNNAGLLCGSNRLSLTSVGFDSRQLAYHAAAMLHRVMRGQPAQSPYIVSAGPVFARQTTDVPLFNDVDLHRTVELVRSRSAEGLSIEAIADDLQVSRSTIERRFKRAAGTTLGQMIRSRRMEQVCNLLTSGNLPLWKIAEQTGYSGSAALSRAFRAAFGETPSEYRANAAGLRNRNGGATPPASTEPTKPAAE